MLLVEQLGKSPCPQTLAELILWRFASLISCQTYSSLHPPEAYCSSERQDYELPESETNRGFCVQSAAQAPQGIVGLANKVRARICRVPEVVTSFITFRLDSYAIIPGSLLFGLTLISRDGSIQEAQEPINQDLKPSN